MRYRARSQLLDDLYLMVRNSEQYNGPQHEITQLARKVIAIAEEQLEQLNTPIESATSGGGAGESSSASAETAPPQGIMDQLEEEAIKQWAQNKKNYGARGAVARSIDNLTAGGKNSQSMKQHSSPPPSSTVAKALVSSPTLCPTRHTTIIFICISAFSRIKLQFYILRRCCIIGVLCASG